jgi:hypothetical protein
MKRVRPALYRRLLSGDRLWDTPLDGVSLDKSWAVLYRFLNFQNDLANPRRMALAIAGGEPFAPGEDYGGPRALSPRLVAGIAEDITGDNDVALVLGRPERYARELDILHQHVDQRGAYGSPLDAGGVAYFFGVLRDFYVEAADAGDAAVLWFL